MWRSPANISHHSRTPPVAAQQTGLQHLQAARNMQHLLQEERGDVEVISKQLTGIAPVEILALVCTRALEPPPHCCFTAAMTRQS